MTRNEYLKSLKKKELRAILKDMLDNYFDYEETVRYSKGVLTLGDEESGLGLYWTNDGEKIGRDNHTKQSMKSTITCIHCNKDYHIWANPKDLNAWSEGGLIQEVLHYLSEGERELLISGTCDLCWDNLYGE